MKASVIRPQHGDFITVGCSIDDIELEPGMPSLGVHGAHSVAIDCAIGEFDDGYLEPNGSDICLPIPMTLGDWTGGLQ